MNFTCKCLLQCVLGLVQGLWLLLHFPYSILTRTTLGYPVAALCLGDSAALIQQEQLLHMLQQFKKCGRCYGGQTQRARFRPGWQLSWSACQLSCDYASKTSSTALLRWGAGLALPSPTLATRVSSPTLPWGRMRSDHPLSCPQTGSPIPMPPVWALPSLPGEQVRWWEWGLHSPVRDMAISHAMRGKTHSLECYSQQEEGSALLLSHPGAQPRARVISIQPLNINMVPGDNPDQGHCMAFGSNMGHYHPPRFPAAVRPHMQTWHSAATWA